MTNGSGFLNSHDVRRATLMVYPFQAEAHWSEVRLSRSPMQCLRGSRRPPAAVMMGPFRMLEATVGFGEAERV